MRQRAGTSTPRAAQISRKPAVRSRPVLAYGSPVITAMRRWPMSSRWRAARRPPSMSSQVTAQCASAWRLTSTKGTPRAASSASSGLGLASGPLCASPRIRPSTRRASHVDQLALLVRLVLGVGDEGQVAVFGGGLVHAFVDRGQHHVGQARHQHADAAAAAGLEAGGVRIGLVAQLGRQRADALDGAGAAAPRASSSEPFRTRDTVDTFRPSCRARLCSVTGRDLFMGLEDTRWRAP